MRKFISLISAAVLSMSLVSMPAQAANTAVIAVYDSDNILVYSTNTSKTDNVYSFRLPEEFEGYTYKVFNADAEYTVAYGEAVHEPAEEVLPEPTEEVTEIPTSTPEITAAPQKTPYPAVYEKALDAVNAPAVVDTVSETIIDGETYYVTTMLYQGVEIKSNIRDTVVIESAPSWNDNLRGQSAAALKEGDVIHFTCDLQGRIKSIEFIYRPDFTDYVNAGGDYGSKFSKLIGRDNYSTFYFGVPVKTAKGYMLLADASGKTTEIDLHSGTFVYAVSRGRRGSGVSFSGTGSGAIGNVHVISSNFDDNDNIISWDDADTSIYALARVRNGTATEVIVFEN
ncbi:MAG: hypothetical protein J1G06_08510 [Oscillospiraceae bacterium]|nr:hypothetical protein [Oscillospiraceae bacterium]